jgi:hypothetical protein
MAEQMIEATSAVARNAREGFVEPAASTEAWNRGQLRSVILLGGTVRASDFGAAIKRALLDLPIGDGTTLLTHWGREISALCGQMKLPRIQVRIVIGRNCIAPTICSPPGVEMIVERDPMEFRGTGGVLRDLAQEYADDDLLLVATAHQLCTEPLALLVERLWNGSGEVRLLAGSRQEPAGLLMLRCGCLRDINTSGFVDLKEQALPKIAARHSVRVINSNESVGQSIRQWPDYLAALRRRHRPPGEKEASAFQEDWKPRFSIVEEGAVVDPTAGVHDSVVLAGGRVEAKANVVRCLIGPGGVARRGEVVVGRLITANGGNE